MRQYFSFKYDIDDNYESSNFDINDTSSNLSDTIIFNEAYKEVFKNPNDEISLINPDSSNNNLIKPVETNISSVRTKTLFNVVKNRNRGRKRNINNTRRVHSADSTDNILNKIQTHFLNFIIIFINVIIENIYHNKKRQFKKFNRNQKSTVKKDYLEEMKKSTIYDLLFNLDISEKYTRCEKNINQKYLKALSKDDWLINIFNMNFLDLFKVYYNDKQPLKEFLLTNKKYEEKKIIISNETKSFYYLLEKEKTLKDNINKIVNKFYINKEEDEKIE